MLKKLALVAMAMAFLTGCADTGADSRGAGQETRTDLSASRIKDYTSIAELQAESTAVVRVKVESSTVEQMHGLPITISKVKIHKTLWGKVSSDTLAIQQIGDDSMAQHDTGAILGKGRQYVLFVKPFHLTPGDDTGRYLITGDQGNFVLTSKGDRFEFAGAGDPLELPKSFGVDEITSGAFLN